MNLQLNWKKENEVFKLGTLEKNNNEYVFKINCGQLKKAIKKGCIGIGNFDLLKEEYRSKNLFPFFKNRIPDKDNINICEIMAEYGLKKYDEMELLRLVGKSATDNYYIEEG